MKTYRALPVLSSHVKRHSLAHRHRAVNGLSIVREQTLLSPSSLPVSCLSQCQTVPRRSPQLISSLGCLLSDILFLSSFFFLPTFSTSHFVSLFLGVALSLICSVSALTDLTHSPQSYLPPLSMLYGTILVCDARPPCCRGHVDRITTRTKNSRHIQISFRNRLEH